MGLQTINKFNSEIITINQLPSGFKPYGNINYIEMEALTLSDMKFLASDNVQEESLIELFKSKIINIDAYSLSWSDFLFICTHISLFSYDSQKWEFKVICKKCGGIIKIVLDKNKFFEFEDLEIPNYPINVKMKGKDLQFGVASVKSHMKYKERFEEIEEHLRPIYAFATAVINMDVEQAFNFLSGITNRLDIEALNEIDKLLSHEVKPIEIVCKNIVENDEGKETVCGYIDDYEVDLGVSTITPFREDGGSFDNRIKSRITFGYRS